MLFADTQMGWPAAVAIIAPLIITAFVNTFAAIRADRNAKLAAVEAVAAKVEVQKVADTLQESRTETKGELASIKKTGEDNHTMGNSATGANLEMIAMLMRERAEASKSPAHIAQAESAERKFKEHQEKQAKVDASTNAAKLLAGVPMPGDKVSPEK